MVVGPNGAGGGAALVPEPQLVKEGRCGEEKYGSCQGGGMKEGNIARDSAAAVLEPEAGKEGW